MIPAQRRGLILDHLNRVNAASILELAELIGVSPSTIRRDLEYLERENYIDRTHGGAVLARPRSMFEPHFEISAHIARTEKAAIGREAAKRVEAGDSVIFDSSSTVREAARAVIARRIPLTAITNDLTTASLFAQEAGITTIVIGGTVRPGSTTLIGSPGTNFLQEIHADLAFIGTHSICDLKLSETSIEASHMKRAIIDAASRVIALADSSKFQEPSFSLICTVDAVDEIITDSKLPADIAESIKNAGTTLTMVPV